MEVCHPSVPPWVVPEISQCPKSFSKKNNPIEVVKAKFIEHNIVHKDHVKFYTDGSKSNTGVGCAVIHQDDLYVAKLPNSASVFSAELTAINKALELVSNSKNECFVIYCDSKSAIDSLKIFNSFHPLVQKAQEWLFHISCWHKTVHFCWVPSHVGIRGNERADMEAKEATKMENFLIKSIPHTDMKMPIRSYILQKWQER